MKDVLGRTIDYLRISLTDKCDLRCGYCMSLEGVRHLAHEDILTLEEIQRLVDIMKGLGLRKVRLTGGEPLVRRGAVELVGMLPCDVFMTTNGCRLFDEAGRLKDAGLSGVNVSLDTINRDTFIKLTHRDKLDNVIAGIDEALHVGLKVKLNCVPIRGINESQIEELCEFAEHRGVDIRFIELMPIGCAENYEGIPTDMLIQRLEKSYGKSEPAGREGSSPALYYRFSNLDQKVGFISPMSHRFCKDCNRVRLTAEGYLKLCLQYAEGTDLRALLRDGADDESIKQVIEDAIMHKPSSHCFVDGSVSDKRNMYEIGG